MFYCIIEKEYQVEVYTGDHPKAGTDANVFLTMFGETVQSPETPLNDSETHLNKFERNNVSIFTLILILFHAFILDLILGGSIFCESSRSRRVEFDSNPARQCWHVARLVPEAS